MTRGKVISFDRIKGYGFVAPDTGGEDVFIHVNDLYSDKSLLTPGCIVEFRLEEGDRGPKASEVTVMLPSAATASAIHQVASAPAAVSSSAAPGALPASSARVIDPDGDDLCDTLSAAEFQHEVTEALLRVEPELTSRQILEIRKRLLRIAHVHGWTDD